MFKHKIILLIILVGSLLYIVSPWRWLKIKENFQYLVKILTLALCLYWLVLIGRLWFYKG